MGTNVRSAQSTERSHLALLGPLLARLATLWETQPHAELVTALAGALRRAHASLPQTLLSLDALLCLAGASGPEREGLVRAVEAQFAAPWEGVAGFDMLEELGANAAAIKQAAAILRARTEGSATEKTWRAETIQDFVASTADSGVPWIVDGLIPEGDVVMLLAAPKVGKTLFMLFLAVCVASGRAFDGAHPVRQCPVLLVLEEDRREEV